MATTCFGQQSPQDAELATFVVEEAAPGATPLGGLIRGAPYARPVEGPGLALGQMRLAIEGGLLIVFGPERDPVPPHTFAAVAAAHPDAPLALPDGRTVAASRAVAVLRAQALGRLGAREPGDGWVLAMLRDGRGPEPASADQLRAELGAGAPGNPAVAADAGSVATGAPSGGEQAAAGGHAIPAAQAEAAAPMLRGEAQVPDRTAQAPDEPVAPTRQADLDPDSMVLVVMRGVPEDARLSTGVRDDDGSWSISPLDLSTVTISLASSGSSPGAGVGEARGVEGDLSITGIALAGDGELVAMSETVPLADYLGDPGAADPAPAKDAAPAAPAADAAGAAGPRMIAFELDPQALAGEAFDALVIRDLPAGARLSAGAYDPAIDGWVLRPQDLSALAILPPPALRADFTVTLLGIALRAGDANAARVLARLPVRIV
jgi:hypothetical protein